MTETNVERGRGTSVVIEGDVISTLSNFEDNTFDACFCDPPYLLNFMNKSFDRQHHLKPGANEGQRMQSWHEDWAREVYRVLKPGATILAFGGTRTYHRLASAIEDVGFLVKDSIAFAWVHGQGFPKSHDIGKSTGLEQWSGYGTAMKPSFEPLVLGIKQMESTYANNALVYGVAGLNIDGSRIGIGEQEREIVDNRSGGQEEDLSWQGPTKAREVGERFKSHSAGRWPSNLLLSHHPDCVQVGTKQVKSGIAVRHRSGGKNIHTEVDKPPMDDMTYADENGLLRMPS